MVLAAHVHAVLDAVLAPCLIKQSGEAVRQHIEQRVLANVAVERLARGDALGVVQGQGATGAQQSDEGGRDKYALELAGAQRFDGVLRFRLDLERVDFAGRERQRQAVPEDEHVAEGALVGNALAPQFAQQESNELRELERYGSASSSPITVVACCRFAVCIGTVPFR